MLSSGCASPPKPAAPPTVTPVTVPAATGSDADRARAAFLARDYRTAFVLLRQLADQGDVSAEYTLGYMYFYGHGVDPNAGTARYWFARAAEHGSSKARTALALIDVQSGVPAAGQAHPAPVSPPNVPPTADATGGVTGAAERAASVTGTDRRPAAAAALDLRQAEVPGTPATDEQPMAPSNPVPSGSQPSSDRPSSVSKELTEKLGPPSASAEPAPGSDKPEQGSADAVTAVPDTAPRSAPPPPIDADLFETNWFQRQSAGRYTIQLLASVDEHKVVEFMRANKVRGPTSYFRSSRPDGSVWYCVVYGSYASVGDARRALKRLPAAWRHRSPWVRDFGSIQVERSHETGPSGKHMGSGR